MIRTEIEITMRIKEIEDLLKNEPPSSPELLIAAKTELVTLYWVVCYEGY